jgi:hypothetical protein
MSIVPTVANGADTVVANSADIVVTAVAAGRDTSDTLAKVIVVAVFNASADTEVAFAAVNVPTLVRAGSDKEVTPEGVRAPVTVLSAVKSTVAALVATEVAVANEAAVREPVAFIVTETAPALIALATTEVNLAPLTVSEERPEVAVPSKCNSNEVASAAVTLITGTSPITIEVASVKSTVLAV